MIGPRDQYLLEMNGKYGYHATWQPNVTLKLGDIGIINRNVFRYITSLDQKGITFEIRPGEAPEDLSYTSSSGVSVTANAAAATSGAASAIPGGAAKANVVVEFGETAGVVFQGMQTLPSMIKDQETLGEQIIQMYQNGQWNTDYSVITELVTAQSLTVLISNGQKAKIVLTAAGQVSPGSLKLADVSAGFSVTAFSNIDTQIIAQIKLTPLFRASWVKRKWWSGTPSFNAAGINPMQLMTPEAAKGEAGKDLHFGPVEFLAPQGRD